MLDHGIVEILGIHGTYKDSFSAGLGFDGIYLLLLREIIQSVFWLQRCSMLIFKSERKTMQLGSDMPREVAVIIQVMLYSCILPAIFAYLKRKYLTGQKAVK